jgi:hypothetical protein
LYKAATEVCEARVRDAAHIAANDPATVLALLDVVEADLEGDDGVCSMCIYQSRLDPDERDYIEEPCHSCSRRLSMNRLKEVLR